MNNSAMPQQTPSKWLILAVLLFILLVGVFLRTYQLASLPPGLFMDEAMNGLDAQDVWRNHHFPVFFSANNGREPLYIYLQAVMLALVGDNELSMRLVSTYTGILTIPLVYVLGRTLFRKTTPAAIWMGTTAAAALAASYWHVSLSRLGFRTILLPLFVMLALLWFWQGWQSGKLRWFGLAGIALGVSQYTYLAARAVPILFIGMLGLILLVGVFQHNLKRHKIVMKGVFFMSVVALLIYLPLGYHLLTTPSDVAARTNDVSLLGQAAANGESVGLALVNNVVLTGRMFVDRGDTNLRHNLPSRAALDWLNLLGFITGLVVLLRQWRKPQSWLLALWLAVMLLPTLLATAAPQYLRASGAVGAVVILVSLGLMWWWERVIRWFELRGWLKRPFRVWLLLPILVLTVSTAYTFVDYFIRWANTPDLYNYFEGVELEGAKVARHKLDEGTVYLIPDLPAQRSPVLQLLLNFTDVRPVSSSCLIFQPYPLEPVTYLVRTQRDAETLPQLQAFLPGGLVETAVTHPETGEVLFQTYTIYPQENVIAMPETAVAQFGKAIQLTYLDAHVTDGAIHITATWQAGQQPTADHTLFIHLYHEGQENAEPIAQLDVQPCYPTGKWQPGEALPETYTLPLPADLSPGTYTLAFGWYTWPSFARLPLVESDNPLPNQRHQLGQITIGD